MAVDRKQQMKEITERLEQGVKDIFTSEIPYIIRTSRSEMAASLKRTEISLCRRL